MTRGGLSTCCFQRDTFFRGAMKQYAKILLLGLAVSHCSNIGFVEKAKAVANNSFGVEVFAFGGSINNGSFLIPATAFLSAACTQGGIATANCACQNEATSRQMTGTFRAWLSITNTVDAICNIQGSESAGCPVDATLGPFFTRKNSDLVVLATDYTELSTSGFRVSLENNSRLLYTGTRIDGRASGADCSGFTAADTTFPTYGNTSLSGTGFTTGASSSNCSGSVGTILCMRQAK